MPFRTATVAIASIVLCSPSIAQKLSPKLVQARTNLAKPSEGDVHRGGEACVQEDSVEAVELMLEIFNRKGRPSRTHLSRGHYRDLLMPYLEKIQDHYARRRVQHELKTNKKEPFVRQWAAEALGVYGSVDAGGALKKALSDKHPGVRAWAAWSLGQLKFEPATQKLSKLASNKVEAVRTNAVSALVRIDRDFGVKLVEMVRGDKRAGVRAALLGDALELVPDSAEALATGALSDADWRPRMAAVKNLSVTKTKTAVDSLIRALDDPRQVIARRAMTGLQKLTGQPISQKDVWPRWWKDNRATFSFPEGEGKVAERKSGETVTFEGIPIDSDHVAFVIDKSIWMDKPISGRGESRDASAQAELAKVLEKLRGKMSFNVYLYDAEVHALSKKPLKNTEKSHKKAVKFAAAESKGRHKNMWLALETVVSQPAIDTVYLISSGEADSGLYVHGNRVGHHLKDLNRFFQTTVHAICYGETEWDRSHVQAVADATGGSFQVVE